jgi:hypothetical protein
MYVIKVRPNKNSSNATATLERVYGTHREAVSTSPVRIENGELRQSDIDSFKERVEKFYNLTIEA